jgi:hypothetical protein
MTVPVQTRRSSTYLGNGSNTSFPFGFKTFNTSELRVVVLLSTGVETETVNYTVSLNPDQGASPGGTVTYPASGALLQTGEKLVVMGDVPLSQTTDLTNGGGFRPQTVEDMIDRTVLMVQEIVDVSARTIKVADTDEANDFVLPAKAARASKFLSFDSNGDPIASSGAIPGVTPFIETLLNDATALEARTTLGALGPVYTSATGGDFVALVATAPAAETALRLDQTQTTSGMSLKLSNSGLNVQGSLRIRSDGGLTAYSGQTAGAASTSGVQALDINPDGNVVVGNSPVNNGRILTVYNPSTGGSAYSRLDVQSNAGAMFVQVSSIAAGSGAFIYSNAGALNLYTQNAQPLLLGTNNVSTRIVIGATGGVTINDALECSSSATVSGSTILNGILQCNSNATVSGTAVLNGALTCNSSATVNGTTILAGPLQCNSSATFNDPVTFNDTVSFAGAFTFGSTVTFSSPVTFNDTVSFAGAFTFGSTVTFSNPVTFNSTVTFGAGFPVARNMAKAWVNFNGTGALSLRNSFNISVISDNGPGDYTINFVSAFANANYSWSLNAGEVSAGYGRVVEGPYISAPTVSAFRFSCSDVAGSRNDYTHISAIFFGD